MSTQNGALSPRKLTTPRDAMVGITLRPATLSDIEMIFDWRNDPFIVARSTSQKTVNWHEHVAWFESTLQNDSRLMFILQLDGKPIGQARFARIENNACVISIYLLKDYTGKGYGVEGIRRSCYAVLHRWSVLEIIACVRLDNEAAKSAFLKASFVETQRQGLCPVAHFALSLDRERSTT